MSPHRLRGSGPGLLVEKSMCGTLSLVLWLMLLLDQCWMTWAQKWDVGRVALTCHFSLDVLCSEMHQPHVFLPQVLSLDALIPVNGVSKACGILEPVKSVQILFRGGHGLGVWDLGRSTIVWRILNSEVEVCNLGLGRLSEVGFS